MKRRECLTRLLQRICKTRGVDKMIPHIFRRSSVGRLGKTWNSVSLDGASSGGGWQLSIYELLLRVLEGRLTFADANMLAGYGLLFWHALKSWTCPKERRHGYL